MTAGEVAIEVDEFLPHDVDAVWAALTDPEQLAAWFMPNDFRPELGHCFTLDTGAWGTTQCEVLDIAPPRYLRYRWRNGPLDTEVVWRLVPEGHGTRVVVEHRGFDLDDPAQRRAFDGMGGGWRSHVLTGLQDHLRTTAPAPQRRDDPPPSSSQGSPADPT